MTIQASQQHEGSGTAVAFRQFSADHLRTSGLARTALEQDFGTGHADYTGRRILLKGGTILSMDPSVGDFHTGDLLIEGKKIVSIDREIDCPGAHVIDASGTILIPGFVDTHRHCWQNMFRRAIPDAIELEEYATFTHKGIAFACRPEDMYAGNLISALGAMYCGITSVLDYSHNSRTRAHVDCAIQAHLDSGLRSVFAYADVFAGEWDHQLPDDLVRVKNQFFASEDQLVSLRYGALLDEEVCAFARAHGLGITCDVAICTPGWTQFQDRLFEYVGKGVLGPDITVIHGTALPDECFRIMQEHGVRLALASTSDAHFRIADGVAPVQQAIDFSVVTGLSVDAEVSLSPDFFSQMRHTFYTQRMLAAQRVAQGDSNAPAPMTTRRILEMATIGGAICNGLETKVGTLSPGKEADILMIECEDILNMPLNNAVGTVVLGADTGSVRNVFIAGKLVKWQGRLVAVDVAAVRDIVTKSRDYLAAETGLWSEADIVVNSDSADCCH